MKTSPIYELWDVASGNLIAAYRSERDALAAVQTFIEDDGEDSIIGVALVRHDLDGDGGLVAQDADLARLAREMSVAREPIN